MKNLFDALIKNLRREVVEQKTAPRRSTLTLKTITKSINLTVSATADQWGHANPSTLPVVNITFDSDLPQLFMPSAENTAPTSPFRFDGFVPLNVDNEAAIIADVGPAWNETPGATITATFKVNITSTGNFTLSAGSIQK
jgi:hypothetical protein